MAAPPNPRSARRPGGQRKKASPQDTRQQDEQQQGERDKVTLILSGGAPHASLMAGALAGLYEEGKTFDHIWTAGAGCLVGLVYIAPKTGSPYEALEAMLEVSISDPIYRSFPVNYKVFKKSSPFHRAFESWGNLWKLPTRPNSPHANYRRLYNDWIDLWTALVTPSDLHFHSKGLCEPLPFLEDLIDFDRVQDWPGEFFLNAYNLSEHKMEAFPKSVIDPLHVRAATAAPFLYPPVRIGTDEFFEGGLVDPLGFQSLFQTVSAGEFTPKRLVLSDILSRERLLQTPRNLPDAYGQSIMTPVVSLAETQRLLFQKNVTELNININISEFHFGVDAKLHPQVLDWSYSNMRELWDIGVKTGKEFQDKGELPNVSDLAPWPNLSQTP